MVLYAADDLDDAIAATRSLLFPFDAGLWFRLALLALFIGGSVSPPTTGAQFSGSPTPPGGGGDVGAFVTPAVIAIVVFVVLIAIVLAALASIFEFVFVEALREREVHVRAGVERHWRAGLRLFGFRIALGIVTLLVVGLAIAAVVAPFLLGIPLALSLVAVLVALPVLLVLGVTVGVVNAFTTFLVVPVMLRTDRGVLSAWGRLWDVVRVQWKQYAAFAVIGWVLTLVTGFIVGVVAALVGLVVFGPLVLFGVLSAAVSTVALVVVAAVGVVLLVVFLVALALVQVPVQAFLRYYSLLVLGDTDEELDYIPEIRAEVRAD